MRTADLLLLILLYTERACGIPGGQMQCGPPAMLSEHVPPFLQKSISGAQAFTGTVQFLPETRINRFLGKELT